MVALELLYKAGGLVVKEVIIAQGVLIIQDGLLSIFLLHDLLLGCSKHLIHPDLDHHLII